MKEAEIKARALYDIAEKLMEENRELKSKINNMELNNKELGGELPNTLITDKLLGGAFGYEIQDLNGNTIADCYKNSWFYKMPDGRERSLKIAEELVSRYNSHKVLKEGLAQAIEVIKQWHNADDVWNIYLNNAPEMEKIRAALKQINQ